MSLPVSVKLLGPAAAFRGDGSRLPALPKKAWVLLAFLLLRRGRLVARDDLAALLWSNTASEQARQSLRQSLSVLRRWLGPAAARCLLVESDTIGLGDTGEIGCDAEEVDQLLQTDRRENLPKADALFRGAFLEGLSCPGEPCDDWLAQERARLAQMRLQGLHRLAELLARGGAFAAAVATARRLTALDPLREESSRLLMRLLAASDQRALALVEHARTERVLREELGLAPDRATRALAESIRRGQPVGADVSPPAPGEEDPASSATVASGPGLVPLRPLAATRAVVALSPFRALASDPLLDRALLELTEEVAATLVRDRWPVALVTPQIAAGSPPAGVRYIVSGAARRLRDTFRILLRLVDAGTGQHLWSGRMEVAAEPFLAVDDALAARIVAAVATAIRAAEADRVSQSPVEELGAHDLFIRATALCREGAAGNVKALELLGRAIELDPGLGAAYALAARCFHLQRLMGWAMPDDRRLYDGVRLAHRAAELSENDPEALWMSGLALAILDGNFSDGRYLMDRSLAQNPNNASAWIGSSFLRSHAGDPETALVHFQRAQEINPDDGSQHVQWHAAALAHFVAGRVEQADSATDNALRQRANYPGSLRMKIATSGLLGRSGDAHSAARRLIAVNPDASISTTRDYWRPVAAFAPDAVASLVDGWRRAGMPEG